MESDIFYMEKLKEILVCDGVRGVLRSKNNEVVEFNNPGVKDLFNLVSNRPKVLDGALVADRVIGRGAALLLAMGKVARVYAQLISQPAIQVLDEAGIKVEYDKVVPNIINRDGTDMCPVEKLTLNVDNPNVAFEKIKDFLNTK